jgi:hypothetical protein
VYSDDGMEPHVTYRRDVLQVTETAIRVKYYIKVNISRNYKCSFQMPGKRKNSSTVSKLILQGFSNDTVYLISITGFLYLSSI